MDTKAGVHFVSKEGINSPGVSCGVSWHDLPQDVGHRHYYWPGAGYEATGEVSPTSGEQSQELKVCDTGGPEKSDTETCHNKVYFCGVGLNIAVYNRPCVAWTVLQTYLFFGYDEPFISHLQ